MRVISCLIAPALFPAAAQQAQRTELQKAAEEFRSQTRVLGMREDSPRTPSVRRGTPWHGRVFENFRNDFLDAVPHEIVQRGGSKGLLRRNQYGFHITGPVVFPRLYRGSRGTHFTFTFEGVREKIARTYLRTVPTVEERTGDWSHVVDQAGNPLAIFDPAATQPNPAHDAARPVTRENLAYLRAPFAANRIPASRLDPSARAALVYYPPPNTKAGPFFRNNFFVFAPEANKADGVIARVDHNLRERHRLGFGLNYSNGLDGAAAWFPTIANPGPVNRDRRSRRATIDHVFTASASSVNTATVDVHTDQSVSRPELDARGRPFPNYRFAEVISAWASRIRSPATRATPTSQPTPGPGSDASTVCASPARLSASRSIRSGRNIPRAVSGSLPV